MKLFDNLFVRILCAFAVIVVVVRTVDVVGNALRSTPDQADFTDFAPAQAERSLYRIWPSWVTRSPGGAIRPHTTYTVRTDFWLMGAFIDSSLELEVRSGINTMRKPVRSRRGTYGPSCDTQYGCFAFSLKTGRAPRISVVMIARATGIDGRRFIAKMRYQKESRQVLPPLLPPSGKHVVNSR
jgi:hypothetical protein